jgi:hypothetical protein
MFLLQEIPGSRPTIHPAYLEAAVMPYHLPMDFEKDIWSRPSFEMNVRPEMAIRDISREDLLIPKGPSKLRMLALTFVGGIAMAMLYVWPPLMIVALVSSIGVRAEWFWLTIAIAAAVFWLTLFTLAVRESAADRRYAEQLRQTG